MSLSVEPIWDGFGARVTGLDLASGISTSEHAELEQLLATFAVLSLPRQPISDQQQINFSSAFGTIHESVIDPEKRRLPDLRFGDVSNIQKDGALTDSKANGKTFFDANLQWHTDLSFMAMPARVTVLSARRLPKRPPPTEYIDMRVVWDDLDAELKVHLETLSAEHSIFASRARMGFTDFNATERGKAPPACHPLVRTQARTGRKTLYLSSHIAHIIELSASESADLLQTLYAHATNPRYVRSYDWSLDDVVIWDDSCTMHRATPFDSNGEVRELRWNGVYDTRI